MRFEGVLQSWNDERGFGFIAPDAGGAQVFVHIKAFGPSAARPQLQQRLSYTLDAGPDGKQRASAVRLLKVGESTANAAKRSAAPSRARTERFFHGPRQPLLLLLIPLLAVLLLVLGQLYTSTALPARWYALMSVVTFFLYAKDKKAAQQDRWRTSENTLLTVGLLCGWPGALLAQQTLRHKSSKPSFLLLFWLSVAANLAWLCLRYSPLGMHLRWPFF